MENNIENKEEIVVEIEEHKSNMRRDNELEYKNIRNISSSDNSEIRNNQDMINNVSEDRDLRNAEERFEVPLNLKKTFICSLLLFILGFILIGIGFIEDIQAADPFEGITFWIIGGIVLIPGGYYTYQFCKARRSSDLQEREDILNDIPEL